jgi:ketosteroid isomerase-like protein
LGRRVAADLFAVMAPRWNVMFVPSSDTQVQTTQEARMSAQEIGTKLVALCREGKGEECKDTLYASDIVSVEASAPPGGDRTARGIEAVRAKSKWWVDNHTVHKSEAFGPYPHGDDRFAVRFVYDITHKPTDKRFVMDEVAVFTVTNGKISKEEFFYPTN